MDLGFLGAGDSEDPFYSIAHGVNESSQAAGRSGAWPQGGSPFFWESAAISSVDYPADAGGPFRGWTADINDSGHMAGVYEKSFQGPGQPTQFGFYSNGSSAVTINDFLPKRISNDGTVLGSFSSGSNMGSEGLWNSGVSSVIPMAVAADMNHSNAVVGRADFGSGLQAALWSNGQLLELKPLDGHLTSDAAAINDLGDVLGWSLPVAGSKHLVKWSGGNATDLAGISDDFQIFAANSAIQIVGRAQGVQSSYAALWENGELVDLNAFLPAGSTWTLAAAEDVNEKGQIVGYGYVDGTPFQRAFLLDPVVTPEPASMILFGLGGTMLLLKRMKR